MCEKAIEKGFQGLYYVPDNFKTHEMCDKVVEEYPCALEFVPDWFVTHQQVKI